ncbi:hypothetical protein SAMN04488047_102232 [Tranquillimonas alkanivorans]|uniref:Uncharacterized protein n=1 Tax=Tranquillimonas alkanivorans TaxID=441119 RepID=A0A1I5MEI1_9RHOB|nr:hypothetical protein SAMN04488047_102232 [Tranquillimonas alkanivorans]
MLGDLPDSTLTGLAPGSRQKVVRDLLTEAAKGEGAMVLKDGDGWIIT